MIETHDISREVAEISPELEIRKYYRSRRQKALRAAGVMLELNELLFKPTGGRDEIEGRPNKGLPRGVT